MKEETSVMHTDISYKDFLIKNKLNRTILILASITTIIQLSIFKYFYPFPSFIHGDSFVYLETAYKNLDINTYLVGYSRFLRLFSVFTSSDLALVAFQYIALQCSALFMISTVFYFYNPKKLTKLILLGFVTLNPLFLHLANLISSDCIFLSLSLIWFSLLLWIVFKPNNKLIICHGIVLFFAFTVRYNALIYPLISALVFLISPLQWQKKIIGFGIGLFLCALFICYTGFKYKTLTGYWQYSPFSGWQMANNAMYAYRYVEKASRKSIDKKFKVLDNMVREYFDSTRDVKKHPQETIMASTMYMWDPSLTLTKYRNKVFKNDTSSSELRKWATMGPLYKSYGLNLIKSYPLHFIKYFIWPNAMKYYAPPVEFLEYFNSGRNFITVEAKNWFGYKSLIVKTRFKNTKADMLEFYPVLTGTVNVIMLLSLLCYMALKNISSNDLFRNILIVGTSIWLLNAIFTIGASSAALRFQSFPILITFIFANLLIDWMVQLLQKMKQNSQENLSKIEFNEGMVSSI